MFSTVFDSVIGSLTRVFQPVKMIWVHLTTQDDLDWKTKL